MSVDESAPCTPYYVHIPIPLFWFKFSYSSPPSVPLFCIERCVFRFPLRNRNSFYIVFFCLLCLSSDLWNVTTDLNLYRALFIFLLWRKEHPFFAFLPRKSCIRCCPFAEFHISCDHNARFYKFIYAVLKFKFRVNTPNFEGEK